MKQIENSKEYPQGAQYAMLTKDGQKIQGFYKFVEENYNDGSKEMRLYHKSSLPVWQPSCYTFEEILNQGFEIVSIVKDQPLIEPRQYITINGKDGEYTGYYDTIYPIGADPVSIEQVHCISLYDGDTMRINREEAIRRGLKPFRSTTL